MKLLERFGMVDYKSVSTPMELNFKKLSGRATGPVLENPTEYHRGLDVLSEHLSGCMFCSEHFDSTHG